MIRTRSVIFIANLLFSFSLAITAYTNSSFIETAIDERAVGVLYAVSAIGTIYILSRAVRTLGRMGNRMFFLSYGALHAISLMLLVAPTGPFLQTLAFIGYLLSGNALIYSFDIFFGHVAPSKGKGQSRGIFLLLGNVGWVFAPLLMAAIIDRFGYAGTYGLALIVFAIIVIMLEIGLRRYKEPLHTSHTVLVPLRQALRKKTLRPVIGANFILQFFYAWMVVYTPIYLSVHLGYSWDTIGILFSLMLTAFVILDYPLGRLADKIGSEKGLTAIGFLIMIGSVLALALTPKPTIEVMGLILFFSRVGAATVEAMTEIHFFKLTSDKDPRLLSVFRDLRPLAYIVAPLAGSLLLTFFPFITIFAALVGVLGIGFFVTFGMEKTHGWWTRAHES